MLAFFVNGISIGYFYNSFLVSRDGGMVDALDLKSSGLERPYGFESRSRYPFIEMGADAFIYSAATNFKLRF